MAFLPVLASTGLCSMDFMVLVEGRTVLKGFPTFSTRIGPLPSVELLVPITVGTSGEGFPTQAAPIWPLSSVDLPVLVQT